MFFALLPTGANGNRTETGMSVSRASTPSFFTRRNRSSPEVVDFVNQKTKARLLYHSAGLEGLVAESEEELDRVTKFIDQAREKQPKFHYQRNTVYLRFCHADYHKGAALAELSRLLEIPREEIFAAGDHHNDISMLDGRFAQYPACPANAIPEVKEAVSSAGGYVASKACGAGVHEALLHFAESFNRGLRGLNG